MDHRKLERAQIKSCKNAIALRHKSELAMWREIGQLIRFYYEAQNGGTIRDAIKKARFELQAEELPKTDAMFYAAAQAVQLLTAIQWKMLLDRNLPACYIVFLAVQDPKTRNKRLNRYQRTTLAAPKWLRAMRGEKPKPADNTKSHDVANAPGEIVFPDNPNSEELEIVLASALSLTVLEFRKKYGDDRVNAVLRAALRKLGGG